ncbi:MAG TPA: response regulator transcription factor [Candidatus Melainabacteria bacterium]|jgi:two-component system, OmpR family, response regulator|nr:response regulator transcription factor [Candidatus Melainabacteria bacterium]
MAKILLIEDDQQLAASIKEQLENAQHVVEHVAEGQEGFDRLKLYSYDVAVLDWMLPDIAGIDVLKQFRDIGGVTPVLMLTGKSDVDFRVQGFSSGADDYLTKPFDFRELSSRLNALLRRPANYCPSNLTVGDLEIDIASKVVRRKGVKLKLLPKEFAVLEFLVRRADHCFDTEALLEHVWSSESDASEAAVWQTIKRLRSKLDVEGEESIIVNVKGMGYKVEKERLQFRD